MASGSQIITGTEGNDTIRSKGNSNDEIFGLGGDDIIDGGPGSDIIDGGEGNDTLTGGPGNFSDTFVFGQNSGVDTVTDFQAGMDIIDLSGTGVFDLTGLVSDDANGNCVIDLGGGNSITLTGVSSATFLSNPGNVILAPDPRVFLGINGTFTDPGDNFDHIIIGDSNGEGLTDTDVFVFGPGMGNDVITDFQEFELLIDNNGQIVTVAGDHLDLRPFGMARLDTFTGDAINEAVAAYDALIDITFLDADGNVLHRGDPMVDDLAVTTIFHLDGDGDGIAESTLTFLGVDFNEMSVLLTGNFYDENGNPGSGV